MELLPKQLWNRAKRYVSLIRSVTEDPSEARARIVFSQISDSWSSFLQGIKDPADRKMHRPAA